MRKRSAFHAAQSYVMHHSERERSGGRENGHNPSAVTYVVLASSGWTELSSRTIVGFAEIGHWHQFLGSAPTRLALMTLQTLICGAFFCTVCNETDCSGRVLSVEVYYRAVIGNVHQPLRQRGQRGTKRTPSKKRLIACFTFGSGEPVTVEVGVPPPPPATFSRPLVTFVPDGLLSRSLRMRA